jgi:hypothetical protein
MAAVITSADPVVRGVDHLPALREPGLDGRLGSAGLSTGPAIGDIMIE